jgi:hypothetical protein
MLAAAVPWLVEGCVSVGLQDATSSTSIKNCAVEGCLVPVLQLYSVRQVLNVFRYRIHKLLVGLRNKKPTPACCKQARHQILRPSPCYP